MCTSPITIFVRGRRFGSAAARAYQVPCGHCLECAKKYQNDWFVRMVEHSKGLEGEMFFITLTYRPSALPLTINVEDGEINESLFKKHVQNWIKRLRRNLELKGRDFKKRPLTYFCTGEYSPFALRPHYHLIMWGVHRSELYDALGDWFKRYGRWDCQRPKGNGCVNYVAKYISKGCFENPKVIAGKVFPTFHLISKNLGDGYLERMKDWHLQPERMISRKRVNLYYSEKYLQVVADNLFYHYEYKGKMVKYHLPRYYRQRILQNEIFIYRINRVSGRATRCKTFIPSALSIQVSDFLSKRADSLRDSQCRQLLNENPNLSYGQALSLVLKGEESQMVEREKLLEEKMRQFYSKGKVERGLLYQT